MISRISGILIETTPPYIILDCHGIGYEVGVPMSTFYHLPALGETTTLLTVHVIREESQSLYGFLTSHEREAFKALTKVSGIGSRTALAVLSGMSVEDLIQAITLQNTAQIMTVPGIGKKTAERLLLELKDKLKHIHIATPHLNSTLNLNSNSDIKNDKDDKKDNQKSLMVIQSDILGALSALGYNDKEGLFALKTITFTPETTVSEGIRLALKALSK